MSYDLYLVRPVPGRDTLELAEALLEAEEEDAPEGVADPEKESAKKRLAAALVASDPGLTPFQVDYRKAA